MSRTETQPEPSQGPGAVLGLGRDRGQTSRAGKVLPGRPVHSRHGVQGPLAVSVGLLQEEAVPPTRGQAALAASQLASHPWGPLWGLGRAYEGSWASLPAARRGGGDGSELPRAGPGCTFFCGSACHAPRSHGRPWAQGPGFRSRLPASTPCVLADAQPPASAPSSAERDPPDSRRMGRWRGLRVSVCSCKAGIGNTVLTFTLCPCLRYTALNGPHSARDRQGRLGLNAEGRALLPGFEPALPLSSCVTSSKYPSLPGVSFLTCSKGVTTLSTHAEKRKASGPQLPPPRGLSARDPQATPLPCWRPRRWRGLRGTSTGSLWSWRCGCAR